jgi:ribosome biogenesis GTPase A
MSGFRQVFKPSFGKGNINWYPGHMAKSLRIMHQKLRQIDCIVEVHDARVSDAYGFASTLAFCTTNVPNSIYQCSSRQLPLTGRNLLLQELGLKKPRILVLNKADLAEPQYKKVQQPHMLYRVSISTYTAR